MVLCFATLVDLGVAVAKIWFLNLVEFVFAFLFGVATNEFDQIASAFHQAW